MTHELTNQEIARVFSQYYGCECLCTYSNRGKDVSHRKGVYYNVDYMVLMFLSHGSNKYKLKAKHLSAISDEDAIEVGKMYLSLNQFYSSAELLDDAKRLLSDVSILAEMPFDIHQYLTQQGYAVPLFIAPNHPDNGKTAIECGIAIDITTTIK